MTRKITLQIDDDDFDFAKRFAEENGYFGAEDFLNSIFLPAIMEWRDHAENAHAVSREADIRGKYLDDVRFVEDPGGGVWLADDLDDDIPF